VSDGVILICLTNNRHRKAIKCHSNELNHWNARDTQAMRWTIFLACYHVVKNEKMRFCGGPLLWGPLFGRTCWTCLNPPLPFRKLLTGHIRQCSASINMLQTRLQMKWWISSKHATSISKQKHWLNILLKRVKLQTSFWITMHIQQQNRDCGRTTETRAARTTRRLKPRQNYNKH